MKVRIKADAHKNHLLSLTIPCYIKPDRSGLVEIYTDKEYLVIKKKTPDNKPYYITIEGTFLLEEDIEVTDDTHVPDHEIIRLICQQRLDLLSKSAAENPEDGYYHAGLIHSIENILKMLDTLYG